MSKINLLAPVCAEDFDEFAHENRGRELIAALNIAKYCEANELDFRALAEHMRNMAGYTFISYQPNPRREDD